MVDWIVVIEVEVQLIYKSIFSKAVKLYFGFRWDWRKKGYRKKQKCFFAAVALFFYDL